jgi:Calpain family cysteine protease
MKAGYFDNIYFLSALSALAEDPRRIQRLFIDKVVDPTACYEIMLNINGNWKQVVIDDFIPYFLHP